MTLLKQEREMDSQDLGSTIGSDWMLVASDRKASKMISELTSKSDDNQLLKSGGTRRDGWP